MTTRPFRADHVGSFLRPKALLEAREAFKAGTIDKAALRVAEDAAIDEAKRLMAEYQQARGARARAEYEAAVRDALHHLRKTLPAEDHGVIDDLPLYGFAFSLPRRLLPG